MNLLLWFLQLLLAAVFFAHGWLFLSPPAELVEQMNASLPRWFQVFLGTAEVAAAFALVVPGILRVQTRLVPLAAAGIVVVMISATIWHLVRAEWSSAAITFVLLLIAAFVTYMRGKVMPIRERVRS